MMVKCPTENWDILLYINDKCEHYIFHSFKSGYRLLFHCFIFVPKRQDLSQKQQTHVLNTK